MRNKLTAVIAGTVTTLFLAVGLTVTTPATAAPKPDDCRRVAKADRTLCQTVKRQLTYTYATRGGNVNQIVNGKALVWDITHQGLTKGEMHSALVGESRNYARYALAAEVVIVNTGTMRKAFGPDAHYEVHTQGKDAAVSVVQP